MFNVRFSLLFCVVYVFSRFSLKAQDVKVSYEAMGKNYILKAENSSFYPYTIQIVFTKLTGASGMTTDVPYISVAGNGISRLLTLKREVEEVPVGFAYPSRSYRGNWKTDSDSSFVYLPPVAPGKKVDIHILTSLEDFFQRDRKGKKVTGLAFRMNEGDTVYAMRGGLVCDVHQYQASEAEKPGSRVYARTENYVVVYHKDGSFATYKLFKNEGVFVEPGENIEAGEPIGVIGGNNYRQGAHLRLQMSGCFGDSDKDYAIEGRAYHSFIPIIAVNESETCKPDGQTAQFESSHPADLIMKEMSKREKKQYLKKMNGK